MKRPEIISVDELDGYIHQSGVLLIDLRSHEEYERSHIVGAINIPYDTFDEKMILPSHKILILYCDRGSSSLAKSRELAEQGYGVKSVAGGIHAYRGKYLTK